MSRDSVYADHTDWTRIERDLAEHRNRQGTLKLSEVVIEVLEKLIGQGMTNIAAAHAIAINESTFYDWHKKGKAVDAGDKESEHHPKRNKALYLDFFVRMERARARRTLRFVEQIEAHSPEDWKAAAWLLERTDPDFNLTKKVDMNATIDDDSKHGLIYNPPEAPPPPPGFPEDHVFQGDGDDGGDDEDDE